MFNAASSKTFRERKSHTPGTKRFDLHKHAQATLGTAGVEEAVRCPAGENLDDWLAANTVDFFNDVNLVYGSVSDVCTPATCPAMTAGPKFQYFWGEGSSSRSPQALPAAEYMSHLFDWIGGIFDTWPSRTDQTFPRDFRESVSTIFRRLFRCYAHIYYHHFGTLRECGAEAHLNSSFKHFILFANAYDLIPDKERIPLQDLINKLVTRHDGSGSGSGRA